MNSDVADDEAGGCREDKEDGNREGGDVDVGGGVGVRAVDGGVEPAGHQRCCRGGSVPAGHQRSSREGGGMPGQRQRVLPPWVAISQQETRG